jgi:hypothetical protein
LIFNSFFLHSFPQKDTVSFRKKTAAGTTVLLYGSSLTWLHQVWYKPYRTGDFHFFDDSEEWLQMDKLGHVFTAFQATRLLSTYYSRSNISKSTTWAAGIAFSYLTAIEIMDGFSSGWGFSRADFWSNVLGVGLGTMFSVTDEISVKFKYSFFPNSKEYQQRPNLLGKNLTERPVKDYNNQTYWISIPVFPKSENKWLCPLMISLGYGAGGMMSGHPADQDFRRRDFFISLDFNPDKINMRSRFLKKILGVFNVVKFPLPALRMNKYGVGVQIR